MLVAAKTLKIVHFDAFLNVILVEVCEIGLEVDFTKKRSLKLKLRSTEESEIEIEIEAG